MIRSFTMMSEDSSAAVKEDTLPVSAKKIKRPKDYYGSPRYVKCYTRKEKGTHDKHLDSDDDEVLDDLNDPVDGDQYLPSKDSQDVHLRATPDPPLLSPTLAASMSVIPTCLYDGHRLLQPGHARVTVHDSDETLLETKDMFVLFQVIQIVLWYLDSGCSRHMIGDCSKLINYVEKFVGTVRFGNDQFATIVGYGDYKMGDTIISRVYYVEGLSHNLFSVGQFCDGGLEVAFRQHTCHIRNMDKVDLLQGSRTTNLYSISLNDMLSASPVCLLTKASSTKSWLWHRCFQGQHVVDSIADKIETTTTYGKFKSTSEAHQVNTPQRLQDKETSAVSFTMMSEDSSAAGTDDEPNAAAAFMANLSSSSSQINEVRTFNDTIFETVSHSLSPKYLATKDSQDVPTEASPDPPSAIPPSAAYMLNTLSELTTQVKGHHKVNQKQALVNATLTVELDRCKLELARLEHNKVKLENDQVILARNKQNAKLKQETESLKTTLRNKEATIAHLTCETKTVLSEKKTLKDKYLEEIVCLKSANQVATGLLQKFQMPTQTIPMLSKKPMISSNDIHKIGLGFSNPWYGRKAQLSQPALYDGHRLLQPGHARVTVHDSDETLLDTKVSRMKMSQKPRHVKPIDYSKLNALYDQFVPQKELSREQAYWLSATNIASLTSDPPKPVTPFFRTSPAKITEFKRTFDELDTEYEHNLLEKKNLQIEKKNLMILNECLISDSIAKDICSIVLASVNGVPPISDCMCAELRSSCDREHNRVLELEAEILKKQQMINDLEQRSAFIQNDHVKLQVKFQNYKEAIQNQKLCDNSNSIASNVIFEINKLKDQLQGRDETIRNLHAQINIMSMLNVGSPVGSFDKNALETEISQLKDNISSLRIQNDGYKIEIAKQNRRYLELSKASTHSRNTSTEKLAALHDEIAKMKPSGCDTKVSGPKTPEKPKVLAPGMYAISSKYIPPPKRADWIPPTPRKKHVTFQEPTRASTRHTKQTAVNNHKKPNVNVIVSTGMKPAAGVSKTQSKSDNQKSRVLPSKNVSARRIEDHPRNLNKKKNVNSSLYVKRFGYVSNKNAVCGACDKCLVSFNHDSCLVINVPSMNTMHAKKPQVARPKTTPKYIRKTDITVAPRIVPQWKPTGRQFLLCDIYGPKKSLTPIAKPLELSPSVSSSSPTTVISRFSDCQLSDRKASSKGISDLFA
ncbi:hypothetical protein Tco_1106204 [Tanacetum coccineum]